jgi:mRNA interferase RelE/StbE
MKLEFRESFGKDIDKVKDKRIKDTCFDLIGKLKELDRLNDLPNVKKLKGSKNCYRIRVGDYRIGIEY